MPEICAKCGLPKDICVCEILEKEETQQLKVYTTKKRFNKLVTIIEGIDKEQMNKAVKQLKQELACGGTAKDGVIVLQGDHKNKTKKILIKMGYPEKIISIE
ncbi:MAG: stress response translation initiation inhibitor YciH [Candidatus Micrarchaeia archaeon]